MKQDDWNDWNESEHLQLDQYDKQFMFGDPVIVDDDSAIFHLVWTYVVKELDGPKKPRCVCDGSTRSGQVRVLDHTYANCFGSKNYRCCRTKWDSRCTIVVSSFGPYHCLVNADTPTERVGVIPLPWAMPLTQGQEDVAT